MTTYGSVCSGIEAASEAWKPLGWTPAWLSEIEPFPCAVLAHRHGDAPNLGDMKALPARVRSGEIPAPDVLVGGTPCQGFSVAGLRQSLADPRGALTLTYVELLNEIDMARSAAGSVPAVAVWENVPGTLSIADNAFGHLLAALVGHDCALEPGPRPAVGKSSQFWSWRAGGAGHVPSWPDVGCVIGPRRTAAWGLKDAQYFRLAQRRKRLFVVASARMDFDPAAIFLEFGGVRRDSPPSRTPGQGFAADVAPSLVASGRGVERIGETRGQDPVVMHTFPAEMSGTQYASTGDVSNALSVKHGQAVLAMEPSRAPHTEVAPPMSVVAMAHGQGGAETGDDLCPTMTCNHEAPIIVAAESLAIRGRDGGATAELGGDLAHALRASGGGGDKAHVLAAIPFDTTQISSPRNYSRPKPGDPCHPLAAGAHPPAVATGFVQNQREEVRLVDVGSALSAAGGTHQTTYISAGAVVRRLTPRECERLQGFGDDYTLIPTMRATRMLPDELAYLRETYPDLTEEAARRLAADGPRYKALGNSMAVPVMRWIGQRIDAQINPPVMT
jgi:DNA (cytosine-5)-methyltransferase 1